MLKTVNTVVAYADNNKTRSPAG